MSNEKQINVINNIYGNLVDGVNSGKKLIMLQGSSRSGKTYNTVIYLILLCLNEKTSVSIVRQSLPSLKRSVLKDFIEIMSNMGIFDAKRYNKTEGVYFFENGSVLEFFSADDEQKIRGSKRDVLFLNEANELREEAFTQLDIRTTKYIIFDFNPSFTEEHWLFQLMKSDRTYLFKSTYKDNVFLSEAIIQSIESLKDTNPGQWQIFGLGDFAIVDGLVFPKENWCVIKDEEFPDYKSDGFIGLDWGYANDPTVAVQVIFEQRNMYIRELFRDTELKTSEIAEALAPYKHITKYCDIDNRLVDELEACGIPLLFMTFKNKETIPVGITLMQQYKMHVTESSVDLIKEYRNYVYKKDRWGNITRIPQGGKWDHGLDAIRYVTLQESTSILRSTNTFRAGHKVNKRDLGLYM